MTCLGPWHDKITQELPDRSLPERAPLAAEERREISLEALKYRMSDEASLALDALELQLRAPDGTVIPTGHISVQDCEYLVGLAVSDDADDADDAADVEGEAEDPDEYSAAMIELGIEEQPAPLDDWDREREFPEPANGVDWEESTLPRYQIHVELVDGHSVPVADRWKDDPYVQALVAGYDPFTQRRDW